MSTFTYIKALVAFAVLAAVWGVGVNIVSDWDAAEDGELREGRASARLPTPA